MKILLLTNQFPANMNTNGIFNLSRAKALRNLRHEVKIIVPVSLTPPLRYLLPLPRIKKVYSHIRSKLQLRNSVVVSGFEVVHPLWLSPPRKIFWNKMSLALKIFCGRYIVRTILNYKPDLIITSELNPFAVYSKYIKAKYNGPIFSIFEGSDVLIHAKKYNTSAHVHNRIKYNTDRIILVSKNMFNYVADEFNYDNIVYIRNGYDDEIYNYDANNNEKSPCKSIITIGRLHPVKGYDILLEALIELKDFTLTIIGEGKMRSEYQSYIQSHSLQDRVTLLGELQPQSIRDYLIKADIFCLPSRSEGLPATPLEAMACGLPVVCTTVGGMSEIVEEGINGFLC